METEEREEIKTCREIVDEGKGDRERWESSRSVHVVLLWVHIYKSTYVETDDEGVSIELRS